MKILLVADPTLPVPPIGYGGIERIVDQLGVALQAAGHEVGLVALKGSASAVSRIFAWPSGEVGSRLGVLRNALALRRFSREFGAEVVHSFARLAYLLFLLHCGVPKIMSYQRQTGGRSIRLALSLARAESLRFTACSDFIRRQGIGAGGSWSTIHNFVDTARIAFRQEVPADAPLLFLSRVEEIKGPHVAIEMARRSGKCLLIAGNKGSSPRDEAFFQSKIAPHFRDGRVQYVGEVNDLQKNDLLGSAAALVVPIQWDEPFGIVFAEALAAGTPVISCPRGALPEIITSDKIGRLVRSVEEGIDALARIHEFDRAACRRAAEERFSSGVAAIRYEALYRRAVGGNTGL